MNSPEAWKIELKQMITDPKELCQRLKLDDSIFSTLRSADTPFPLRVTPSFLSRIRPQDPDDPLLKQVLPLALEDKLVPGFQTDPLQEKHHNPIRGLLHKYKGRVLITMTGSCAIHCRYCFRRHFPYTDNMPHGEWDRLVNYLQMDQSIHEVILSGGDPLLATDAHLTKVLHHLETVAHLKTIRIHSRLPVVLPSRITTHLIEIFKKTRLQVVVVMHCNHPQEIDESVKSACLQLHRAGLFVFNQAVLLQGVNDKAEVLVQLSHRLWECHVLPYYLHLLDQVSGAAHFDIPLERAQTIYHQVRSELPGYLVPLLVREVPDASAKTPMVGMQSEYPNHRAN